MNDRIETMARNMELYKALLAAKTNMPVIEKKRTVTVQKNGGGSYKYSYADLADLDSGLAPVLTEHKLLVAFEMHDDTEGTPILTGMLVHPDSGGYLTSEWKVTGRTPQDQGSSITYGRRYLTGILTGVITDEDTDGRQENPGAPAAPQRRAARPANRATPQQVEQLGLLSRQVNMPQLMHTVLGRQATPDDITDTEATKLIDAANTTQS